MKSWILGVTLAMIASPGCAWATPPSPIRGVVYGPSEHENLTVFPCESPPCESVDFTHEGGFHEGNMEGLRAPAETQMLKLQAAGLTVFDANYPSDSGYLRTAFPLETDAVESLVTWTDQNAASYGGDPNNLVLLGASAGGMLALWAGEHEPTVKAVASLSGITDFAPLVEEAQEGTFAGAGPVAHALGCLILHEWEGCTTTHEEEWSPVDHVPSQPVPTYVSGSEDDRVPYSQQLEMAAAVERAGGTVQLREIAGSRCHAIVCFPAIREELIAFLKAH